MHYNWQICEEGVRLYYPSLHIEVYISEENQGQVFWKISGKDKNYCNSMEEAKMQAEDYIKSIIGNVKK